MRRTIFTLTLLISFFASAAGSSDGDGKSIPWNKITKLCYNFGDSSKPADEKRDYSITIDEKNVWLSVRCEDKILIERRYDNTPEAFHKTIKALRNQGIEKTEEGGTRERGCSSEQISFYAGDECVFSAYREGEYGNLYLKHGEPHDAFEAAVP